MEASILVITVDLKCCRCRAKITKVLDCLKAEYCIEKTEFEDKDDKVIVRGNFDAGNLRNKIYCKAGGKVVKEIKIVDAWPETKKTDQKPVCKLVPFPVPYPAPPPACGGAQDSPPWWCRPCSPTKQCYYCCAAPPPRKPKPCEYCTHCHGGVCNKPVLTPCGGGCSSDDSHCDGGASCGASKPPPPPATIWPPQPSFYYPPLCGGYNYKFACEENNDVCAIM